MFISQVFHALSARNMQNRSAHKKQLYLYDNYNVKCYSTNPLSKIKETPARLVNALAHGLNENQWLPRLIIITPDGDVVQYIGEISYGIYEIIEKLMKWVISAMYKLLEARKDALTKHKSGAISYGEPKLIWVKMIDCVQVVEKALVVRNKFNRALENLLVDRHNHYVIDINHRINQASNFLHKLSH